MNKKTLAVLMALPLMSCVQAGPVETAAPAVQNEAEAGTAQLQELREIARDTYVWGYPLVQAAIIRLVSTRGEEPNSAKLTAPIHSFAHGRVLANPDTKIGVGPNNDTLYSLIWMDMEQGPFVLETPAFGDRYYTFSLNQSDSASPDSLGQRTHGGKLPTLFIHGPDFAGTVPDGMLAVEATTRYFELAGRTLVRGEDDYAAVHALQDAMYLTRYDDWRKGRSVTPAPTAQRPLDDPSLELEGELVFLENLGQVMKDWWVRDEDRAEIERASAIGLSTDGFDPAQLNAAQKAAVIAGLEEGKAQVLTASRELGTQVAGWTTNYSGARFGNDWLLRSAVAKDQIYVAVPEEAIYPIARTDAEGNLLNGTNDYRIVFPEGQTPPVGAFWSITLYDDVGIMVPNPIDRYSIGDRTGDLKTDEDGNTVIVLSNTRPEADYANWLPAPEGPFYLMMRLYIPSAQILDGTWQPPAVERVEAGE